MKCPVKLPKNYGPLYRKALEAVLPSLSVQCCNVIHLLLTAPEHTNSAGAIAHQLGLHHVTVNAAFSQAGRAVLQRMNLPAAEAQERFQQPWWILARKGRPSLVRGFAWELRPEVVATLESMDFINTMASADDELSVQTVLTEAQSATTTLKLKQRNSLARQKCLSRFKPVACQICGLDFAEKYDSAFQDCIHVHHLNPLALAQNLRAVNPDVDLIPVCPNCHAVIHAHGEVRPPDTVRALIQHMQEK